MPEQYLFSFSLNNTYVVVWEIFVIDFQTRRVTLCFLLSRQACEKQTRFDEVPSLQAFVAVRSYFVIYSILMPLSHVQFSLNLRSDLRL